jgi:hypothetical protein
VQPQPLSVVSGDIASFFVEVSGRIPLAYQWYFNSQTSNSNLLGNKLANQTNASLSFTSDLTSGGYYNVVITNRLGTATSIPALLTLITNPIITLQPQSITTNAGNSVTFTSAAIGAGILKFQWYFQTNTVVVGATNATLNLTNVDASLAGVYLMIVTNNYGRATSSVATLTVLSAPSQPQLVNFTFNSVNGSFSLLVSNRANSVNQLWATTNLASTNFWRAIATNVMPPNGLWFFTDTNIAKTNAQRFYRFSSQ